jgi:hypothetical protein
LSELRNTSSTSLEILDVTRTVACAMREGDTTASCWYLYEDVLLVSVQRCFVGICTKILARPFLVLRTFYSTYE